MCNQKSENQELFSSQSCYFASQEPNSWLSNAQRWCFCNGYWSWSPLISSRRSRDRSSKWLMRVIIYYCMSTQKSLNLSGRSVNGKVAAWCMLLTARETMSLDFSFLRSRGILGKFFSVEMQMIKAVHLCRVEFIELSSCQLNFPN